MVCADYIDAQIVKKRGYLDKDKLLSDLTKEAIAYGEKRYIYKNKNGEVVRRTEKQNLKALENIKYLLDFETHKKIGYVKAKECEEFLLSDTFCVYMPHSDGRALIRILRQRANEKKRMNTGYPDIF